jgi:hypothetical protein
MMKIMGHMTSIGMTTPAIIPIKEILGDFCKPDEFRELFSSEGDGVVGVDNGEGKNEVGDIV